MKPFASRILRWYATNKRELPWRATTDPYKILVAEMMLQQTQVSRVLPIYSAFLQRFPSAETLAKSELGDVLHAWKGLGYNRRAKHLWQLSRLLPYSNNRKRVFPTSSEELQKLPGIGHYTQAAIRAFSYNADVVAQDTNVRRIHVRVFGEPMHVL